VVYKTLESVLVFVTNLLMKVLWIGQFNDVFRDEIFLTVTVKFVGIGTIYVVIFPNSPVCTEEKKISYFNSFSDQLTAATNQQVN